MENAEQEFVSVVREYERVIYKVCYLYTTPNATLNDLYQEVVLNLWKAFPKFRRECKISTWIYRIALNTCISFIRKEKNIPEIVINGDMEHRVCSNLNVSFNFIEGESLMMAVKDLAVSSGSACTSASLEPSYVLKSLGRSDELAHSSIRFTLGRFTTEEEIDFAVKLLTEKVAKLRELSPLWEMHQQGVDLNQVQWSEH